MSNQKVEVRTVGLEAREIWFEVDGSRLFAVERGEGRPVVFLHGGLADHRAAVYRVGQLAGSHRLLTPDLRGSGRSVHRQDLSWDRLADDVAALLAHLGTQRAVVGGTSMGSAVALRFALRHPGLVQGLILMSPLYPGADRPLPEAVTLAMQTMKEAGERVLEHGIEALRPLFENLPPPVRDVALQMMLGFDPGSVAATTRFLGTNEQPMQSVQELESIDVPVVLVPGADPQHPREVASLYAEHLRYPTVVEHGEPDMSQKLARFCADLEWVSKR